MVVKNLLKLALLTLPLYFPAYADTNLAGDVITTLDEPSDTPILDSLQPDALPPLQDYTSDSNDSSDTDLWQRIKSGYAMQDLQSPYTSVHESWYASRPDYVKRMIGRSQKYLYHVVEEVQKRGMPTEIALLPMVESAFNPQAYSRSHASGIWQFVPSTGKNFGLKQTWWVDNRRDIMAATDAALDYLQKLHVMFGTWELALAAYNAGEGTVMRAIERNRRNGLPTDYQSLRLPPETQNYVPKLQAVKNIVSHPEQFGLNLQPIANKPYFTTVSAPKQIDVDVAVKLAGISKDEFVALNPEYNRPVLTSTGKTHDILLPVDAADTFTTNLASYDKPLVTWQSYYAKRGERLETIARKFGASVNELREVNDLQEQGKLKSARQLMVPLQSESPEEIFTAEDFTSNPEEQATTASFATKRHLVKRGETLSTVAKRYGVTSKELMTLNHLKSAKVRKGQVLLVQTEVASTASSKKPVAAKAIAAKTHYVVRRGDTLYSIARKFDVSTADLKRWNKLDSGHLVPGRRLNIQNPDAA